MVVPALVSAGARVVIADLNSDAGIALATEHSHTGALTLFVKTNVVEEESVRAAVRTAVQTFGGLHVLINCAGIGPPERVLGKNGPHDLDTFSKVIQVNLIGTFNAIRLAAAEMAEPEEMIHSVGNNPADWPSMRKGFGKRRSGGITGMHFCNSIS